MGLYDAFKHERTVDLPLIKECRQEYFLEELIDLTSQDGQHRVDWAAGFCVPILFVEGAEELIAFVFTHEER